MRVRPLEIAIVSAMWAAAALWACDSEKNEAEPRHAAPEEEHSTVPPPPAHPAHEPQAKAESTQKPQAEEVASKADPASAEPVKAAEEGANAEAVAHPALLDPSRATAQAPADYTVRFETSVGDLLVDVHRAWAPLGADRFYNLVKIGYFKEVAFFRVIDGFMAQAGIHGAPEVNRAWRDATIEDDPVKQSNTRGTVSFAMAGKGTRTTQFFVNFGDNSRLDAMGFAPFGKVRNMDVLDKVHAGYGEGAPMGRGPSQAKVQQSGNAYLKSEFPELDYILDATLEP